MVYIGSGSYGVELEEKLEEEKLKEETPEGRRG